MKAVGLVVEYNPFHNGHLYHAQTAKRQTGCDTAVAVMSGYFYSVGNRLLCQNGPEQKWRCKAELILLLSCLIFMPCKSGHFCTRQCLHPERT